MFNSGEVKKANPSAPIENYYSTDTYHRKLEYILRYLAFDPSNSVYWCEVLIHQIFMNLDMDLSKDGQPVHLLLEEAATRLPDNERIQQLTHLMECYEGDPSKKACGSILRGAFIVRELRASIAKTFTIGVVGPGRMGKSYCLKKVSYHFFFFFQSPFFNY